MADPAGVTVATSSAPTADRPPTLRALQAGQFELAGTVTTPFVARLRSTGLAALRGGGSAASQQGSAVAPVQIALDKVTRVDSAGLALLIDWLAFVQQSGRQLRYSGGPPTLRALARLSDVEQLIYAS